MPQLRPSDAFKSLPHQFRSLHHARCNIRALLARQDPDAISRPNQGLRDARRKLGALLRRLWANGELAPTPEIGAVIDVDHTLRKMLKGMKIPAAQKLLDLAAA